MAKPMSGRRELLAQFVAALANPRMILSGGIVGSGLSAAMRRRLGELLFPRLGDSPWIECEEDGLWVEPGLYCKVSYLERTRAGHLRAPVFLDLIVDA